MKKADCILRSAFQDVRDESPRVGSASYRRLTRAAYSVTQLSRLAKLLRAASSSSRSCFLCRLLSFVCGCFLLSSRFSSGGASSRCSSGSRSLSECSGSEQASDQGSDQFFHENLTELNLINQMTRSMSQFGKRVEFFSVDTQIDKSKAAHQLLRLKENVRRSSHLTLHR